MDLENMINTKKLAEKTNLDKTTIRHLANTGKIPGAINPNGFGWLFPIESIEFVKSRPETRGRKKAVKND